MNLHTHYTQIGQYVRVTNTKLATYGQVGVVVDMSSESENGITQATVMFGNNVKHNYNTLSLVALKHECKWAEYDNQTYLVTPKLTIISRKTGRIMKWAEHDAHRIAILQQAGV